MNHEVIKLIKDIKDIFRDRNHLPRMDVELTSTIQGESRPGDQSATRVLLKEGDLLSHQGLANEHQKGAKKVP